MSEVRIAVTGASGFVGHHLARELRSQDISVAAVDYRPEPSEELSMLIDQYHAADLTQEWPEVGPVDAVIHLAGFAAVGPSFDDPQRYINGNSAMVTNLCEYYVKQGEKPRIIVISSGALYDSKQEMPIDESGVISYDSPYVVSKVLTENQCAYYRNRGLDIVVLRPFNHIGPGQAEGFILPDLYKQISEDTTGTIKVGNLETRRDYTDVRDIVRAYGKVALAPSLEHTTYNVCSGQTLSGMEILNSLKSQLGKEGLSVEVDPTKIRPTDAHEIMGDSSRLQQELSWKPEIAIEQTIRDFVDSKR